MCLVISFYLSFYEDELNKEHMDEQKRELQLTILNDIVESKFIDSNNHSFRIIIFQNKKKFNLINSDTAGFFNYLLPNDSIVKDKGSDLVKVFRGETIKEFKLERGFIND
jgi:hypothetical protein